MTENLAEQSYWDESYKSIELSDQSDELIESWIREFIPQVQQGRCFEVGCFPGRFLTIFGRLGYELNGVDLTPRVETDFPQWLKSAGYKTGHFAKADFLQMPVSEQFDLVCSFGFIEHFRNWKEVFIKHLNMVKPGGYVVIETPNFRGLVQRGIHYFLDRENYRRHYIPSMAPGKWKSICEQHGFEVLNWGHLGRFTFWVDREPQKLVARKIFLKLLDNTPRLAKLGKGLPMLAPYCGIIARRIP